MLNFGHANLLQKDEGKLCSHSALIKITDVQLYLDGQFFRNFKQQYCSFI